jgi:hypothetical protein
MKYFTQLIKSYSRLHEAEQQLDPIAQQKALQYFGQANATPAPQGGSPLKTPVTELGGNVYKNQDGKVIFDGFPGRMNTREINPQGKGPAKQNFNEFVSMLSSVKPAQGEAVPPEQGITPPPIQPLPAGKADPKAQRVSDLEAEIVDSKKLLKLIGGCDTEECNIVRNLIERLNNASKGSLVDTFNRASKIITSCVDQGWKACKRDVDKQSQVHKDAAYRGYQKALSIIMGAVERASPGQSPTLTTEEEAILNNSISISTAGQFTRVAIVDDSGNGMLITQYNQRSKMISASLSALLPGLKNSKGQNFKFNSDIESFVAKKAIAQKGSFARGFLYEKLVLAANKYVNCQSEGNIENKRKCVKEVSDELLSYVQGQENVTDALRDIVASLEESGEMATVVDDEISNAFIDEVVIPTVGRGGTSEDILMELAKVSRRMGALAVMGDIIRRAPRSENNATKVGKGRRADNIEIYPTEEAAKAGIDRMGFPENIKNKISIEYDKDFGGFTIGNGLKFTSSGDDIKAGQAAADKILEAENNPEDPIIKRWHDAMETHMGVTAENRGKLKRKIEKLERFSGKLKNLPETVITKDSNGKEITLSQREQAMKMVTENLRDTLGLDTSDDLVIGALSILSESSMASREWEETCDLAANAISKANLRGKLYSGDLKDFDSAVDELLTVTAYAGVAGDNPMLTVARAKTGVLYTTAHNEQMNIFRAHLEDVRNQAKKLKDPEARIKFLKQNIDVNTKSISFGGKYRLDLDKYDSKGFHIGIEAFMDKTTTTAHSARGAQGLEAPRPVNASTTIDRDQLMKFLVEQKTTLDRMISIIARDGQN